MENIKTFVIHVKGNKEREKHIKHELQKKNIEFEFILDGNREDIAKTHLEKYFRDELNNNSPQTSCVLKHFFAYEKIVQQNIPFALIFEDDIELYDSFQKIFELSVKETLEKKLANYLVSYEASTQNFISKTEESGGQWLYKKNHGRCAGAYLLDLAAAKAILTYVYENKCNVNVDWLHNELSEKKLLHIFWCHPPIAEQQSHNGKMQSLLDQKKQGRFYRIKYFIQKNYKEKLLRRFR